MSAVNPNWHRWVYASLAKHIHSAATAASLPMVVEFLDKRGEAWNSANSKAEATITGPATRELSQGLHRVWADVFIVLTSKLDSNNYDHIDFVGQMANALDQCILVKDYGATGLVDVGNLTPRSEASDSIQVVHVKPTEKDTQIHSTIEARYYGLFTE